ncbi:ribonuclease P protein component [Nocardioides mangrovicus]|uniref:Ribonuclease P protein component n=1 Tax=Nocardioides mangrovicus TaxID=2478913 RepID=A0A3L8NXY9_9ACTN|nr:ribonuclease P protein component [Nocardioides mangrovicus]RLV48086.1 ribonuclease P protein component [Nocardioides mangrovicus]
MLTRSLRLLDGAGFDAAVRGGRRAGSRLLVVHHAPAAPGSEARRQIGFVVSRAVGGAVVRNRVKRRLRHLMAERTETLPAGTYVVRAQPAAAAANWGELGEALDRCVERVLTQSSGRERS